MSQPQRTYLRALSLFACSIYALACDPAPNPSAQADWAWQAPSDSNPQSSGAKAQDAYEVIPRVSIQARQRGVQTLLISSQEHPMEIEIYEDHDLVNTQTTMVRDGKRVPFEQSGHAYPWIGHVVGEEDSAVQLVRSKQGLQGVVISQGRVFELKPGPQGRSLFGQVKDPLSYAHEHGISPLQKTCEVEDDGDHEDESKEEVGVQARDFEPGTQGCREAEIVLVADHYYVKKLGSVWEAEFEMMRRMGEVNLIFRKQLGIRFRVQRIYTFPDEKAEDTPEFNKAQRDPTPLEEFRDWKNRVEKEVDVAHLFVARTVFGKIGLARRNSVCGGRVAASVSNYVGESHASTVVVAHELGHNFGAKHDTTHDPYIMAPVKGAVKRSFSQESMQQFAKTIPKFHCLKSTTCEKIRAIEPVAPTKDPSDPGSPSPDPENPNEPQDNQDTETPKEPQAPQDTPDAETPKEPQAPQDDKTQEIPPSKDLTPPKTDANNESPPSEQAAPPQKQDQSSSTLARCSVQGAASKPWKAIFSLGLLGFALRRRKGRKN